MSTSQTASTLDSDRADYIAAAWNSAYERAYPPDTAYDKAEAAGKAAALAWDAMMAAAELEGRR